MGRLSRTVLLGLLSLGAIAGPAQAADYVVDSTLDSDLQGCVDATPDDCTLRGAINKANLDVSADVINFGIPSAGTKTITLGSALPPISKPVTIDGYTQSGASANTQANFTSAF